MEQLRELLKQSPNDSFLRHAMALELEKTGEDLQAILTFKGLLADDPAYVGSYYQLGRLLEKVAEPDQAILWYEKGIEYARKAGEKRAQNELQSALDELLFD
jgi:tetratricopeptide (TPR) repeat protein